jgi:probable HAF family extracellular repeat protein
MDLGELPGGLDGSVAYGVNDRGQVVGSSATAVSQGQPFLWQQGQGMTSLGDLPGGIVNGSARAINIKGQVAGFSHVSEGARPFLWTQDQGMRDLGYLPGGAGNGVAYDINAAGQVVGFSGARAFLWQETTGMVDLALEQPSQALAINDAGQIVGRTGNSAFLWENGGVTDLGTLEHPGLVYTQPTDINRAGQVVGLSAATSGALPFFWQQGSGIVDLNSLLDPTDPLQAATRLVRASAINDRGQILAAGLVDGVSQTLLLTPVGKRR